MAGKYTGRFAQYLTEAMDREHVDLRGLSEKVGYSYEYLRRIRAGLSLPSVHVLKSLCAELKGLDRKESQRALVADRIRMDYGTIPLELAGKNPDAALFDEHVSELTPDQREALESLLRQFLSQNAKRRLDEGPERGKTRGRKAG
jgi:hypothetical protein